MRQRLFAVVIMLVASPSFADSLSSRATLFGNAPTDAVGKGLVIQPMFTSSIATFGVDGRNPNQLGFGAGPELRIGWQFLPFSVMAHVNFAVMSGVNSSTMQALGFGLDLTANLVQLPMWPMRLYITASGDAGPLFWGNADRGATFTALDVQNGVYPTAGGHLAIGAAYAICKSRSVNFELGYHHQWTVYNNDTSSAGSVFVALGASFLPFESCGPASASEAPVQTASAPSDTSDDGAPLCKDVPGSKVKCAPAEVKDKSAKCETKIAEGWLEASQGAYADDPIFLDKQVELERLPAASPTYHSQLEMVKDRPTVLIGVHHYKWGTSLVPVHSRKSIVLRGTSNCSLQKDVKLAVTLTDQSGQREVVTTDVVGQVPIDGPALDRPLPWSISVDAFHGLPKDKTFSFKQTGDYNLSGELVQRTGEHTGLKVQVSGKVVAAGAWRLAVLPVSLGDDTQKTQTSAAATALAEALRSHAGEWLPLDASVKSLDYTALATGADTPIGKAVAELTAAGASPADALAAVVADRLGVTAANTDAHRLFVVFSPDDWKRVSDASAGLAASTHVIFIRAGETLPTAIREMLFTVPQQLWSGDGCGRKYYKSAQHWANGIRVAADRAQWDAPYGAATEFSSDSDKNGWVTQCGYINVLRHAPMPATGSFVVHGVLANGAGKPVLKLGPIFSAEVGPDMPVADGNLQVELKNAQGKSLAKVTGNVSFESGDGANRKAVAFDLRVPEVEGTAEIVVTAGGATDTRKLSGQAPSVKIAPLKNKGKMAHVTWTGTGEQGKTLTYTLLTTADGQTWNTILADSSETQADVATVSSKTGKVRVVVSDGTRSSDAIAPLR